LVDPLTEFIWLGPGKGKLDTVARLFLALADGLRSLDEFYTKLKISLQDGWQDCFFPHVRSYPGPSGTVLFKYISRLLPDQKAKALFKGKTSSGQRIVVKFTSRYHATAHRLVAKSNLAPQLLYISSNSDAQKLSCPIMVVMEFLEGKTAEETFRVTSLCQRSHPDHRSLFRTICEDVKEAVRILHNAGLAFGDLRAPNIMIVRGRAKLVDFDWCGEDGQQRYPGEINMDGTIDWHKDVKPGGVMTKDHDNWMARQLFHTLQPEIAMEGE
jgi:serine/threonine protein kinase